MTYCFHNNVSISALLYYLIDGLIPLVKSFCGQLAKHSRSGLNSKKYERLLTPPIVSVLKAVSDSVEVSTL